MLRGEFRLLACLILAAVVGALAVGMDADASDACTEPGRDPLAPECLAEGTVGHLHRQACDYQWVEEICASTRFPDPGYSTDVDLSPGQPLELRVGAVHEHSSYSDGDPDAIPADYFRAGRTGHNVADAGGDTGVKLDFMFSSEHSDNTQIPITTSRDCIDPEQPDRFLLACGHFGGGDHYWKWPATLRQANEGTERSATGEYTGFTGIRGFEYTNDYFNHLNVYFSNNFRNVKIDGSYLSMDVFWDWLREPVAEGGGADGLVTFNHPGGDPKLTPFDDGLPHTQLLAQTLGGGNWNDVAYVPDVDDNVVGMEINGGDDIDWYVRALTNGWHIGAFAAEDEHQLEWSTSNDGKTLILTRGRSPKDYYFAVRNHRTIAIRAPLVDGAPGTDAIYPAMEYYADGGGGHGVNSPNASPLGSTVTGPGTHHLNFDVTGLPAGSRVAMVSNTTDGQSSPIQLGTAGANGFGKFTHTAKAPASGEDWYFVVVCSAAGDAPCGSDQNYSAVTAPIWLAAD